MPVCADTLDDQITALDGQCLAELRRRWLHLYGHEAPLRISRQLLIQAIAYRVQEQSLGRLPREIERILDQHKRGLGRQMVRTRVRLHATAGTRLLRERQGRTYEVITADDGAYLYRGQRYKSLSHIAREITGTQWSGPAFFGLKRRGGSNGQA